MKATRNARPFLVSGGAGRLNDKYTSNNNANRGINDRDRAALPRRASTALPRGGASGRRTSAVLTARRTSRFPSSEVAAAIGAIPENNQSKIENGAGRATPSASRAPASRLSLLRFRPAVGAVAGAKAASRKMSTLKAARRTDTMVIRSGATTKKILERHAEVEPQPAKPVAMENDVQAERQQRRKRGLNMGLSGNFFGARNKSAKELFRGISALPGHPLCCDDGSIGTGRNNLWMDPASCEQDFLLSRSVEKVDCFVSHAWARDRRDKMFKSSTEFTDFKAAELKGALDVIAKEERTARKRSSGHSHLDEMLMRVPATPLVLWIDKFCVSPDILERRLVIERHMDYFLANSEGLLVLLSSSYFRRLWCVYEWGCFVAMHGVGTLGRIRVCLSWLCCSPTFQIPLLAQDIETLSVSCLKCSELNDQLYLRSTIGANYRSTQAFERMVQISAICALSTTCAVLALDFCTAGHPDLEEAWRAFDRHLRWRHAKFVLPWRHVAVKLGLTEVCSGLDSFWGQMQRSTKMSVEGAQQQDNEGPDSCFVVASPPRNRLRFFANAAARAFLAVLVRKARASAVVAERPSDTAMVTAPSANVGAEEGGAGAAKAAGEWSDSPTSTAGIVPGGRQRGGSGHPRQGLGGVIAEGNEGGHGGSRGDDGSSGSSSSSSSSESEELRRGTTLLEADTSGVGGW